MVNCNEIKQVTPGSLWLGHCDRLRSYNLKLRKLERSGAVTVYSLNGFLMKEATEGNGA
jgi:hypothetical protein